MKNSIQEIINDLVEKEAAGVLVDSQTIAAVCEITQDFGDKVAVRYYRCAFLAKARSGKWKLWNSDLSVQIKDGVFPKDTVAKWQFFAREIFSEIPENFVQRFIAGRRDLPTDIENFCEKVAFSNLDEKPTCGAIFTV